MKSVAALVVLFVASLIALVLAAALAGIGALLFGRRPRRVVEWNEAFLAGAGLAAALLFPCSIVLGPLALPALFAFVASVGLGGLLAARPAPVPVSAPAGARLASRVAWLRASPIEGLLAAWIAASVVLFAIGNGRYHLLWDGLFIWATKAMLLFDSGCLTPDLWVAPEIEGRVGRTVAYPYLVPLLQSLVATARGAFDFDAGKSVFLVLYASLLAGTWSAGRALGGKRAALLATALVAALPPLSTSWAAGGYADMPQAAAAVGLAGALLRGRGSGPAWRRSVPWLFGAVLAMKSEGTILSVVALCGWGGALLLSRGLRGGLEALRRQTGALLVVGGLLAVRLSYIRWTHAAVYDREFRPLGVAALRDALGRSAEVAGRTLVEMANVSRWGLLWPAFAAGAVVLLLRPDPVRRTLAACALLAVGLYVSVFLFTNWPVALHMQLALDRVLSQVAPLAVLVVVSAFLADEGEVGTGESP